MGPRTLTYNDNVEHIQGQSFRCPRFHVGGAVTVVEWVCTDAVFDPETGQTKAEFDVVVPS